MAIAVMKGAQAAMFQESSLTVAWRIALAAALLLCLTIVAPASAVFQQTAFSYDALNARLPVTRQHSYVVNARIRPILLFWISRNDVGTARITWRQSVGGSRAFELLIGSDPARTPRRINRWGFIVEEMSPGKVDVLGVMKESSEETIEEAEAEIARGGEASVFKVGRTTIAGNQAVSGTMTVHAPAELTYRELDDLLALIPAEPPSVRTLELPSGTRSGFLVAMESLFRDSAGPCRSAGRAGARNVSSVPYVYNQTIYDLTLLSCEYEPELKVHGRAFGDAIDGRFEIKNRTTNYETKFRVFFGASGKLRELPIRAVFRPRWWMEVELVLDESQASPPLETAAQP